MQLDPELLKSLKLTAEASLVTAQTVLKIVEKLEREDKENLPVPPDMAAAALGKGISAEMLVERCRDGRFKYKEHFINTTEGSRGNYLIKVAAVRKFFETDPAKRPSPKRKTDIK